VSATAYDQVPFIDSARTIDKLRAALGPSSIENGDPEATTSAVTLPQRSDMTPRYRSISPTSDLDFDFLVSDTPSYATDLGSSQALRRPNSTLQDTYKTPHSIAPQLVLLHDILAKSLRQYLRHVHRLFPVVDPDHLLQRFNTKVHLHDRRFAAFLLATCALALFSRSNTVSLDVRDQAAALVDMAISLHNTADLGAEPSLDCIATSMVLSAVSQILQGPAVALVRHREAIALAETLNLSDPRAYDAFDPSEKELFFRILWLLAIAERSNSLLMFRPITMKSPISSLPVSFQLRSGLSFGLQPTARLYEAISPALIDCINGRCSSSTCMLSTWTILTAHEDLKVIGTSECISDVQRADILLTGQWLHMKLWQCCATHMLLTGSPDPPELAIEYPLRLLAKTMDLVKSLSRRSIICNGHAMVSATGDAIR
jgi:hypothetical protein